MATRRAPTPLRAEPDEAILQLVRALARAAAREDHEQQNRRDLRPLLD